MMTGFCGTTEFTVLADHSIEGYKASLSWSCNSKLTVRLKCDAKQLQV